MTLQLFFSIHYSIYLVQADGTGYSGDKVIVDSGLLMIPGKSR